jgi:threonine dehydrogenase-like Zn-dependent dehydrogenase
LDLARLVVNEVNLLGSRCGDMALALHFLAEGLVDPTPLIEATYPLARFPEALERARRPGARKVIVEM